MKGSPAPQHMRLFLLATIFGASLFGQQQDRRIQPIVAHRQVALVIGNSAYASNPLRNPVNDAQAMGQRLRELNYDVTVVTDAGYESMGRAIDGYLNKLMTGDVAFFYYSGHGMQVEGENYLIPVDFQAQNEADVRYRAHAAGRIQERMEKSGAQLNILVLDACRNNPFRATSRSGTQGLAAMSGGRGTFIAFATAPGRTASDNPNGRNGLFTQYLLDALATPGLGLNDVFDLVRVRVDDASGGKQLPWTLSSVVGRYSFAPPSEASPISRLNLLLGEARSAPVAPTPAEKPPASLAAGTEADNTAAPANPGVTTAPLADDSQATLLRWVKEAETDFDSHPPGSILGPEANGIRQWDPKGSLLGSHCEGIAASYNFVRCDWDLGRVDQATAVRQFSDIFAKISTALPGWKPSDDASKFANAQMLPHDVPKFLYFRPPSRAKLAVQVRIYFGDNRARGFDGFVVTAFVEKQR